MKKLIASTAFVALLTSGFALTAQAQTAPAASPDGVGQIDQRLNDQQNRIDNGVKDGQIDGNQQIRDEKTDAHVSQELSKDEAKNGGTVTRGEQKHMNKQLNKNSKRIHHQRKKGAAAAPVAPVAPAQ